MIKKKKKAVKGTDIKKAKGINGLERLVWTGKNFWVEYKERYIVCGQFSLQLILTAVSVGGNRSSRLYISRSETERLK